MYIVTVQTCMYMYIQVNTLFYSYKHVHTDTYMSVTYFLIEYMYVKVCTADVLCTTDGYIHFMKCTDIIEKCTYTDVSFWFSFFICPAGWPKGRVWLLPGVTPMQVQAHLFNLHQPK
jgi:hypothetical protein